MKSLQKVLDILEYVFNQERKPVTPTEVAKACGVPVTTAGRILGELTKRSYTSRVSRNAGYVAGPVVYTLADRRSMYGCIAHGASEPIKKLAIKLDIHVNISVLHDIGRYILFHYTADRERSISRRVMNLFDYYYTGTGRILMAFADRGTVDRIVERIGLPDGVWPEVACRKDLDQQLDGIRQEGHIDFTLHMEEAQHAVRTFGQAVFLKDGPVCALGSSVNANRLFPDLGGDLADTAKTIAKNVASQCSDH